MHVSAILICLQGQTNPLFVRDKYVTPTGKRLHAGYLQKKEASVKVSLDTIVCSKRNVRVVR